jgi:ribosomal subunit interface protein
LLQSLLSAARALKSLPEETMPFRISGKNIDVGEALRDRINARIVETLSKYFDGGYSGHLTVGKDGFGFRTECVVHLDSGFMLQADATAGDAYASADQVAVRFEKRLRRYKNKLKDHQAGRSNGAAMREVIDAPSYVIATPEHEDDAEIGEFNPVIIAESTTALKQLSVSEAVTELDFSGAPVVVFRHAGHGRVNLVYRRADGHIGWVDPPALAPASN